MTTTPQNTTTAAPKQERIRLTKEEATTVKRFAERTGKHTKSQIEEGLACWDYGTATPECPRIPKKEQVIMSFTPTAEQHRLITTLAEQEGVSAVAILRKALLTPSAHRR